MGLAINTFCPITQDLLVVIVENKYKKEDTSQTSNDDNILPLTSETHLDTVSSKKYYIIC